MSRHRNHWRAALYERKGHRSQRMAQRACSVPRALLQPDACPRPVQLPADPRV